MLDLLLTIELVTIDIGPNYRRNSDNRLSICEVKTLGKRFAYARGISTRRWIIDSMYILKLPSPSVRNSLSLTSTIIPIGLVISAGGFDVSHTTVNSIPDTSTLFATGVSTGGSQTSRFSTGDAPVKAQRAATTETE